MDLLSVHELASMELSRSAFKELYGTFLIVFIGVGAAKASPYTDALTISVAFGTGVSAALWATGGHLNPAVTLSFLTTQRITLVRAVLYIVMQIVGAVLGSCIVYALTPAPFRGTLGSTTRANGVTVSMAFFSELFGSFFLIYTIWSVAVFNNHPSAPGIIGVAVAGLHLVLVQRTGAGLNPARSFGPAAVTVTWDDHWIYWVAPILGGMAAALSYEYALVERALVATPQVTEATSLGP